MKTSSTSVSVQAARLVVLRDRRAGRVDAAGVGVALGVGQVVDHVGDDRLGRLEPERRGVADVELEDLVALGLEPLGLDQDRSADVVADVLQLAALDDRAHGAKSRRARATALPDSVILVGTIADMRDITLPADHRHGQGLFRLLGLRFQMTGTEHIPRTGGALLAVNHVCFVDFVLAGYAAQPSGRLTRFMAKQEVFDHPVGGPVMRSFHHIAVDRADGIGSLRRRPCATSTRARSSGSSPRRRSRGPSSSSRSRPAPSGSRPTAGVPLIPVILWGTQRLLTKGNPRRSPGARRSPSRSASRCTPTGKDPSAVTAELHRRCRPCSTRRSRPTRPTEQPPGSWWLPARLRRARRPPRRRPSAWTPRRSAPRAAAEGSQERSVSRRVG